VPNPDIAAGLGARKGSRVLVGFALEAAAAGMDRALGRAQQKLQQKHLDLIVVNLSDAVGAEESQVVILAADGGRWELPRQDKPQTAAHLVQRAVELWERNR